MNSSYVVEYTNENEFKKLERAIKKYNMLAYKKLIFEYYPNFRIGKFAGILVSKDKKEEISKYELKLPTDRLFSEVHGDITLCYSVYENEKIVMLENIIPSDILMEGHRNELSFYKGVPITKSHADKDMFKINLLNSFMDDKSSNFDYSYSSSYRRKNNKKINSSYILEQKNAKSSYILYQKEELDSKYFGLNEEIDKFKKLLVKTSDESVYISSYNLDSDELDKYFENLLKLELECYRLIYIKRDVLSYFDEREKIMLDKFDSEQVNLNFMKYSLEECKNKQCEINLEEPVRPYKEPKESFDGCGKYIFILILCFFGGPFGIMIAVFGLLFFLISGIAVSFRNIDKEIKYRRELEEYGKALEKYNRKVVREEKKYNKLVSKLEDDYNNQLKEFKLEKTREKRKISSLRNKIINYIDKELESVNVELNNEYNKNVLLPKYRCLVGISSMYMHILDSDINKRCDINKLYKLLERDYKNNKGVFDIRDDNYLYMKINGCMESVFRIRDILGFLDLIKDDNNNFKIEKSVFIEIDNSSLVDKGC